MAFAMAFTMMAGAAYTDQADITAVEAVDTLTALGVMSGYNGEFRPNDTITRAEACRMIYSIRSKSDNADAYKDMATTFTDIKGHWAEGFIKHCQSVGIVSGRSAQTFDPDANVTGVELALMCLRVVGYDPAKAGIGGTTWSTKTIGLATEAGLLDDVETSITANCPREWAAQIMFNMLDANTVKWSTDNDEYDNTNDLGVKNETVGAKYMDLYKTVATMTDFKKTSGKDTYEASLTDVVASDSTSASGTFVTSFSKIADDYSDLLYKQVKVLYKKSDEVYGIYATEDNTEVTGLLSDLEMDGAKAKLDGTKYDLADSTTVYVNGVATKDDATTDNVDESSIAYWINTYGDGSSTAYQNNQFWQGTEVTLLATDGSTNFSILKVETAAIAKVTAVGSDYINVTVKGGDRSIVSSTKLEDDDWVYYDGVKKDDYVVLTAGGNYADGDGRVEKADVVSGKVTSTKSTDGVAISGEWYTMAGDGSFIVKRPSTGSNVDMVIVNGYVYFSDTTAGSVEDVALLVEAAPSGGTGSKWEARLIFADGTDKVVEIEKYWADKDNKSHKIEGTGTNGAITEDEGGILVSYETSGGVYTLTQLGAQAIEDNVAQENEYETAGYDVYVDVTGENAKTDGSIKDATYAAIDEGGNEVSMSRLYYESTGVVFVKYKADENGLDADYKVVSGKVAQDYDKALVGASAVADKSGSSYYAQAAFINLGTESTGGSSDNYAVVLSDVVKDTSNGTVYQITAWNGTDEITVTTDDSAANSLKKGDIFTYTGGTDNADIEKCSPQDNYYVSGYDAGSGDIELYSAVEDSTAKNGWMPGTKQENTATLNKDSVDSSDTVVLYVNSDAGEGVAEGEIELAYYYDDDFFTETNRSDLTEDNAPNVRCYFDDNDYITVIVVDVNRNITEW